ncbi:cytochrome P450 [Apiospora hydei]|uniref:Cytochrome P450 n=1 Tax=Apiospora hydei TaxID=1337664 RepID=A0ABR1UVB9_9PEZI
MDSATTLLDVLRRTTLSLDPDLLRVFLPLVALISLVLFLHQRDPLKQYPGPILASKGRSHVVIHELHRKYGPIVRLGPNILDLDVPELVKIFYSTKAQWKKTEFYHGSSSIVDGKIVYNIFSQTDPGIHTLWRKPISKHYSTNGVLPLEPHIDNVLTEFCTTLESRYPIGFLEKGCDFNGVLHAAKKSTDYFAAVSQIPVLDYWLDKNPVHRIGPPSFGAAVNIALQHLVDRSQGTDSSYHDPAQPDYLDKFIEVKKSDPETVDDSMIISYLMINLLAGADTTAITLRSVFYYGIRDLAVWSRLQKELDGIVEDKTRPVSWRDARSSPYLEAVMREAIRMLPGVAMNLERYVPEGRLVIPSATSTEASKDQDQNQRFVPAGTIVGLNPYVVARNTSVYGDDADAFRPDRWLKGEEEPEAAYQARLAAMNAADLSFGAGARVCIGKNLALLQAYKVVATLAVRYDIELANLASRWRVTNSWFPRQEGGLEVRLKMRAVGH